MDRLSFLKTPKGLLVLSLIVVSLVGIPLTVFLVQQQQSLKQEAWRTTQSASAVCDSSGKAVISVSFTNTEPSGATYAMNVTAKDLQTTSQISLGTINPGETKTGTIPTTNTSLPAGVVQFTLTWADGTPGTDSRSANYNAVSTCTVSPTPTTAITVTVSPTPTLTLTLTPTKTPTPTLTPTKTPTPTLTLTLTLTPTKTPTPTNSVTNTPTPTNSVTNTPTPTNSVTNTPTPTNSVTNSPTSTTGPTQLADSRPTLLPTGPSTTIVQIGFVGILIAIIGGLLLIGL